MITSAILCLAAFIQFQGPEARAHAAEWRKSPPPLEYLESVWENGDGETRRKLLESAWLAKTPESIVVLGWAQQDEVLRGRSPWAEGLIRMALDQGHLPGEGPLKDHVEASRLMFHELIALSSWRPSAEQLEAAIDNQWARESALRVYLESPSEELRDRELDLSGWTEAEQMYLDVHRALFLDPADAALLAELPAKVLLGRWNFEQRKVLSDLLKELGPHLPAGCLDDVWKQASIPQRSGFMPVLESAPASVAWEPLRSSALAPMMAAKDRATAVRRLFALDGERANSDLLGLLASDTGSAVLQPTLFGMRAYADSRTCGALESLLPDLSTPLLGPALEVLILWGDARQQSIWQRQYPGLSDSEKRSVIRAAMWTKQDGIEDRVWTMLFQGAPQERAIANSIVREFMKADAHAAGALQRVLPIVDLDQRITQLRRFAFLQSELIESSFRDQLSDPVVAAHPMASALATRLVLDSKALPMFEAWWDGSVSVSPAARYVAAAALAPTSEECQAYLRDEFWNQTTPEHITALSTLRELPTSANLAALRQWMSDSRLEVPGRLHCGTSLVLALNETEHARSELHAALTDLEFAVSMGLPIDRVAGALLLSVIDLEDEGLRFHLDRVVELAKKGGAPGAEIIDLRLQLRRAALGLRDDLLMDSVEQLLAGLAWGGPALPHDKPIELGTVARDAGFFDFSLNLVGAYASEKVDPILREKLEATPQNWHPDRLWLLRHRFAKSQPNSLPWIDALLAATEPPGTVRSAVPEVDAPRPIPLIADQAVFFRQLEEAIMGGDLVTADALLDVGMTRFDGDRRLRQWKGWTQIAKNDLDGAEESFTYAYRLGATLPYLHMEQTLGLAVVAELRDPASDEFESFMDYEEQAANLLRARLPVTARPDLAGLVPPEEEQD